MITVLSGKLLDNRTSDLMLELIAAFIIMKLIEMICPVVLPLVGSAYFDLFDGFLQAYIFFFLTTLYISEAIEDEE